jgi:hypothetical protein
MPIHETNPSSHQRGYYEYVKECPQKFSSEEQISGREPRGFDVEASFVAECFL